MFYWIFDSKNILYIHVIFFCGSDLTDISTRIDSLVTWNSVHFCMTSNVMDQSILQIRNFF